MYHALMLLFCSLYDLLGRYNTTRARTLHRMLIVRKALLELAGSHTGSKLFLGRICFMASTSSIWIVMNGLTLVDDPTVFTCFIISLLVAYCGAGLAAVEPRHSLPNQAVQWLCTGWGLSQAPTQCILKIVSGLLLLPFTPSAIIAQVCLRSVAFIVWLSAACPCCRLRRNENVYDAFEHELCVPLLQCGFLAFGCILAFAVQGASEISYMQRFVVGTACLYYTGMLLFWVAPAVLQAKVAAQEACDAAALFVDEGQIELLQTGRSEIEGLELEELQASYEEVRALLRRERHDNSILTGQLKAEVKDEQMRLVSAQRELAQALETSSRLSLELKEWRDRCEELNKKLVGGHVCKDKEPAQVCRKSSVDKDKDTPPSDSNVDPTHVIEEHESSRDTTGEYSKATPELLAVLPANEHVRSDMSTEHFKGTSEVPDGSHTVSGNDVHDVHDVVDDGGDDGHASQTSTDTDTDLEDGVTFPIP